MFLSKFDSLLALSESVREAIVADDLDRGLNVIHDFVERIITEPLCASQVYGSRELDALCQEIGRRSLSHIASHRISREASPCHGVYAYLITKLQKSGGHTRIIEEFIRARPKARHVLLSTELSGRSSVSYFLQGRTNSMDVFFESAPRASFAERLTWLQSRLLAIRPDRSYLFNHHQDSVAVAAIQPEMGLPASYYHHGDHHLCLGVFLSHLDHIDPHPMGYYNCREKLGIENRYVPLTVEERPECRARPFRKDGMLVTCTAARSNKVEIPYYAQYTDLVPRLLQKTKGRHVHIGRLTPWALLKIRRGLSKCGVPATSFVYIPWVSNVWKALVEHDVDLYIASFPYGGGLTLIEAMGAGVPVAVHRHIYSRILSGIDLAYSDVFSWRSPDALIQYCVEVTAQELEDAGSRSRAQYETFHRWEVFAHLLDTDNGAELRPAELMDDFEVQSDEWAAWVEQQLSFRRLVWRTAYRLFRYLRRIAPLSSRSGVTLNNRADSDGPPVNEDAGYFQYLNKRSVTGHLYRQFWLYPILNRNLRGRVLDVGCGIGDFLAYRPGTIGVDVNSYSVDWCRQRGLDARSMEVDHLPFEDESFDGVVLDNVLEHLSEPARLLSEIKRVLMPGGRVLVGVPGTLGYTCDTDHQIFYDESNLRQIMEAAGLMQKSAFYMPFKWDLLDAKLSQYCLYGVFERS